MRFNLIFKFTRNVNFDKTHFFVLQLNDTTTLFLGGTDALQRILSYDWNTETYTEHPELWIKKHIYNSCAVLKDEDGNPLVVTSGSFFDQADVQYSGLEAWSPVHGTTSILSEFHPDEEGALFPLRSSQMISINDGSELLMYGGFNGNGLQSIWKFTLVDNTWAKTGSLPAPKFGHEVLPVWGIECP